MPVTRTVNHPRFVNDSGDNRIRRYVHQPMTIEHNGINASIQKNGKVTISKVAKVEGDEVEYDEIEVPASLIFKLGNLLRDTRKVDYVTISETSPNPEEDQ